MIVRMCYKIFSINPVLNLLGYLLKLFCRCYLKFYMNGDVFQLFRSVCFQSLFKKFHFPFLCFMLSPRLNLQKSLEIVSYVAFFSTWKNQSPGRKHGVLYLNRKLLCCTCMVLPRYVQRRRKRF